MNILGLAYGYHDAAACLVQDGAVIAAAQEERFNRRKHYAGFPLQAVNSCLQHGGITIQENADFEIGAPLGGQMSVAGTIVRNLIVEDGREQSPGLVVDFGTKCDVSLSMFRRNVAGGMLLFGNTTQVSVVKCAVLDTGRGSAMLYNPDRSLTEVTFGDGIMAKNATVDITDSLIAGNERSGVYFNGASGSVSGSVIVDNLSFGLVMVETRDGLVFKDAGNFIVGNASELPKGRAMDITDDPGALPVPPSIEPIDL